ncbi:MAG: FAD-dependent thymidylate synthase [Bacilli bacterium]
MKIVNNGKRGDWKSLYKSTLNTIGVKTDREPTPQWKKRILMSEHSPIRKLNFQMTMEDLKYWVSVHLVRHKHGIEHFVSTQRTDRTNTDRDELRQDAPVSHDIDFNAQAAIQISRKRLCYQASLETREAWQQVVDELAITEPELASLCVKECVYRNGLCPEFKTCGYNKSKRFKRELAEYQADFVEQITDETVVNRD